MSYGVAATVYFQIYGEEEGGMAKSQKHAKQLAENFLVTLIGEDMGSDVGGPVRFDIHEAVPPTNKWKLDL